MFATYFLPGAGRTSAAHEWALARGDRPSLQQPGAGAILLYRLPACARAIVQSIYASDDLESAYSALLHGIQRGFGLANVGIYQARAGRGKLTLVKSDLRTGVPSEIDLTDLERVEVQTFRSGDFALRGAPDDRRLVVLPGAGAPPFGW